MASSPKVLVIGDDTRSFLACVRSLGRSGVEVHAAPYSLDAPALQSRYIHKVHLLPYYLNGGAKWLQAMQALLDAEQFDMVLPCEERGLLPLCAHKADLPVHTVLAIPDPVALDAFFDKVNTRELAQRCGVPVPDGYLWQADSSLAQLQARLGLPVAAKHRQSYSLQQLYVRTQVRILEDAEALGLWLKNQQAEPGTVFFEKIFNGIGLGVSVLCHQGKVLQAFEHHRANELAGSSYYRKSMPLDAGRVDAVARMVAATQYTGLAMFEFKLNVHTATWVLLEVNARPWGSLPLPVAWGVDFPYRLFQLLCVNQKTPAVPYPIGRYNRNLIADIWQMRTLVAQLKLQPLKLSAVLVRWLVGFGRLLLLREKHDVLVLDDPAPAWTEIKQFVSQRMPKAASVSSAFGQKNEALVKLMSRKVGHLLFVCQGNICRSPYAEAKARSVFKSAGLNLTVDSAGMLPRNRRPSPPAAIAAAGQCGIDLSAHLSQCADQALISAADVVVVFDDINVASFKQRHPDQAHKLVHLSAFNQAGGSEIADPDGKSVDVFKNTYATIDACLQHLVQKIQSC
jgi:protein-tyrosine-phosphatase/predicted ATP-grasp superfamily ATP-dependent carboligase